MRTRLGVLLTLLVVVSAAALIILRRPQAVAPVTAVAARTPAPDRRLDLSNAAGAEELAAMLSAAYRLPADRRMVSALSEIDAVLLGMAREPYAAAWGGTRWVVRRGNAAVDSLPEMPSFADGLACAERHAREQLSQKPLADGPPAGDAEGMLAEFMPEEALRILDESGNGTAPTQARTEQAMRACVQLALLLSEDRTGYADTTFARALALLALARVATGDTHPRETCALMWAMGYGAEAADAARGLAASDPLRAFVLHDDAGLARAAAVNDAGREARLLALIARARSNDLPAWIDGVRAQGRVNDREHRPLLATALSFRRFDVGAGIGQALVEASLLGMPGAPSAPEPDSLAIAVFEAGLLRPDFAGRGAYAGAAIAAARRALFYSGLVAVHDDLAHLLASPEGMRQWAEQLPRSPRSPAAWFVRWERHLAAAADNPAAAPPLWNDLADPEIPAPLVLRTFESLSRNEALASSNARAAVRGLTARLDSRPAFALRLGGITQRQVQWPDLSERLLAHASRGEDDGIGPASLLLALLRGDTARLRRILSDARTSNDDLRRAAETWVLVDSSASEQVLPLLARRAARVPGDWDLSAAQAQLLEARGQLPAAEAVILRWMRNTDSGADALDSTIAVTRLARLQRKQGRVSDALATIGNLDRCQQRGAMREKARLLACTGRMTEALEVVTRIAARYPQSRDGVVLPVVLPWCAGRFDAAAEAATRIERDDDVSWDEVGGEFADLFHGRPAARDSALAALRAAVPAYPHAVWRIVFALERSGDHAGAAQLVRRAPLGSGGVRGYHVAHVHELLERVLGADSARVWLERQRMDDAARLLTGGYLALAGRSDAAWQVGDVSPVDEGDWIVRAMAWRMTGSAPGHRLEALQAHLAVPGDDHYRLIYRYLMGVAPETELLTHARGAHRSTEVWFYCGVRAWSEGRAHDALRWFTLCQEAGSTSDGEFIWSRSLLLDWCALWRTSERLIPAPARPA